MNPIFMLVAVLLPILGSLLISFVPFPNEKSRNLFTEILVCTTSILILFLVLNRPISSVELLHFNDLFHIMFQIDDLGTVFLGILAVLWPLATLYAFEYMEEEERKPSFFTWYVMTYGITVGIAMAENLVTMYFFYELLTLVTVPLVIHEMSKTAIRAGRVYIYYSMGGAAFGFISLIALTQFGSTLSFRLGGVLDPTKIIGMEATLRLVYVLSFCGFSVKAAIFPFSGWLPKAGVAPTPVTALLHAVAVVKAGAFATMRLTYYSFGCQILKGTWAQYVVLALAMFTIVYGCSRALKESHLKRRLAWSTVGNLSYILFGVALMSPAGLVGALAHMVCHAAMKITSFLCAGAIIHQTHKSYIFEMEGIGRKMPITCGIFLVSSLALMGVPGLCGFVSKWYLATAAVQSNNPFCILGVGALMISALLTAIYMLSANFHFFFPRKETEELEVTDPGWKMLLPLVLCMGMMVYFGLFSTPIIDWFMRCFGVL